MCELLGAIIDPLTQRYERGKNGPDGDSKSPGPVKPKHERTNDNG